MTQGTWDLMQAASHGTVRDAHLIAAAYMDPERRDAARVALAAVLSRARARDIIWLEANRPLNRVFDPYYPWPAWNRLAPADLPVKPGAVHKLATFHANGYVREAAVAALASSQDPDVLPFLLLRANDWVDEVAVRARRALEDRLRIGDARSWILVLPYESHVRRLRRRALGALFDDARRLLLRPEARGVLREALSSGAVDVRRACAQLVSSLPAKDRMAWLSVAIGDRDPVVATSAGRALLEGDAAEDTREWIGTLLRHRVARVRLLALISMWARFPAEAHEPSRDALFDTAASVREVAQVELRSRGGPPLGATYAEALQRPRGRGGLLVTISGLSEVGTKSDAALISPHLHHRSPRVRAEVIRALRRLDADAYTTAFVEALHDASPRVARSAFRALEGRAHLIDRGKLDAMLAEGGSPAQSALRLLPSVDYWGAMLLCLQLLHRPELHDVAVEVLRRLLARQTYSIPPNHAALEQALALVPKGTPQASRVAAILKLTRR